MTAIDDSDNNITNPSEPDSAFSEIVERRYSRRGFLKTGFVAGVACSATACDDNDSTVTEIEAKETTNADSRSSFDFVEIEHGNDKNHHVAPDHTADILLRWGDPLFDDAPEFDLDNQSAAKQLRQFGYNNDFIGFIQLKQDVDDNARALLCINHEYPLPGLMFPDFGWDVLESISAEQVAITQAAVGVSIVEIREKDGEWQLDRSSKYNRRITALDTEIQITGPAAGHPRLQTSNDPAGNKVIGTFNNCAGGITPWGTYLTCEENFNLHFSGELTDNHPEFQNHSRYNLGTDFLHWAKYHKRFDFNLEPNEPNRFGWVVEIDPMDPESTPKKRTALGRFKHEGAENVIAKDGRFVIYMGDDQHFEYIYKFVSRDTVDLVNKEANKDILDEGTVYVAKFHDDGRLDWLPLDYANPLLAANFASQADILIQMRSAADLLGATPMDRPEDVVPNAETGKVYVMLTNNTVRMEVDAANPRELNTFGHIIEITEGLQEFSNTEARWDMLVKCGDPSNQMHDAQWSDQTSENGWFASPDNGVIDPAGRLWVSTDQGAKTSLSGTADGLWGLETQGDLRGTGKMFFRVPKGAEMCGPAFSDDAETLFLSVQHPGDNEKTGKTRINNALTRWPDFVDGQPPRPSVVVVRKKGGGKIG